MVLPAAADHQTPASMSVHPYSHAIQLKLYQAFIFSIPILFSIILFLLFYLFYLKRRAYNLATSPITPPTFRHPTSRPIPLIVTMPNCQMDLKGDLKEKLPMVVFDEQLKAIDSLCCVCLGEFEMKEELIRMPSCKHMFHGDCISHWLRSNSTCPLCRSCVVLASSASASVYQPNLLQQQQQQTTQISISNPNHHQVEVVVQQSSDPAAATLHQQGSSSSTNSTTNDDVCSTRFNGDSVEVVFIHVHPL